MTAVPRKSTVIETNPRLIAHFAKAAMRVARLFGPTSIEFYAAGFTEKQQQLMGEYIRNHRKKTKEQFT
jgi:hypothetical protein